MSTSGLFVELLCEKGLYNCKARAKNRTDCSDGKDVFSLLLTSFSKGSAPTVDLIGRT